MKRPKEIAPWNYQPKHKIDTKVMSTRSKDIGIIKRIDNFCNWEYHKKAMPEYYIKWKGAWTRHDCTDLDEGVATCGGDCGLLIVLTPTVKLIYGKE